MTVISLLSFLLFLVYLGWLSARIVRRSLTEWLLTSFLLGAGSVIFTGFVLSALYQTNNTLDWAGSVFGTATLFGFTLRWLMPKQQRFSVSLLIRHRRYHGPAVV